MTWCIPTHCYSHSQLLHTEVIEREFATKLCQMFGSGPHLKIHVQNLEGSLPVKYGAQKLPIFG